MEEGGGEMPVPLNTTYGGVGLMMHHHHDPQNHILPSNGPLEDHVPFKRAVRYRECLKNHAAAMGGSATDGCGEFMPSGGEGTLEALTCSACSCHRNFHRKETEGDQAQIQNQNYNCDYFNRVGRKIIVGHHPHHRAILGPDSPGYPRGTAPPPPLHHHHHPMILSYNMGTSVPSESDDQEDGGGGSGSGGGGMNVMMNHHRPPHQAVKKRFRTKFTQEQKEKMLVFAEKVGWKIQKQDENVVQQFCQEVGVKRRVLKVWMHNNKHSLAKKSINMNMSMNMNINASVPIPNNIMIPPQNHVQNQV